MSKHPKPAVIAFGRLGDKPPRAAWFCTADAAIAQWLAARYRLTTLPATPDLLKTLEATLAQWQLGPDGHPVMPVISMRVFTRLQSLASQAETGDPAGVMASVGTAPPTAPPAITPEVVQAHTVLWEDIGVHSVVLATAEDPAGGWWEAVVLAIHNGTCTLRWRDFPDDGLVTRKRQQLALLPPAS